MHREHPRRRGDRQVYADRDRSEDTPISSMAIVRNTPISTIPGSLLRQDPIGDQRHQRRLGRIEALQLVPRYSRTRPPIPDPRRSESRATQDRRGICPEARPASPRTRESPDRGVVDGIRPPMPKVRHRLGMDDDVTVGLLPLARCHEAGPRFGDWVGVDAVEEGEGSSPPPGRSDAR